MTLLMVSLTLMSFGEMYSAIKFPKDITTKICNKYLFYGRKLGITVVVDNIIITGSSSNVGQHMICNFKP